VHTLAAKYAGGGHRHAAGLISDKPLHRPQRVATDADDAGC
jgi:nanoRNase/pAp phosphatase (c-di-AMP/oligoRNAs hydrolase)